MTFFYVECICQQQVFVLYASKLRKLRQIPAPVLFWERGTRRKVNIFYGKDKLQATHFFWVELMCMKVKRQLVSVPVGLGPSPPKTAGNGLERPSHETGEEWD